MNFILWVAVIVLFVQMRSLARRVHEVEDQLFKKMRYPQIVLQLLLLNPPIKRRLLLVCCCPRVQLYLKCPSLRLRRVLLRQNGYH